LLNNPINRLTSRTRSPAVEPEGELIRAVIHMRYTHGSLMRSQQPPFGQGNNSVCKGQQILTDVGVLPNDVVVVSHVLQSAVATPAIGSHTVPGSTHSWTAASRLFAEASRTRWRRILPIRLRSSWVKCVAP